MPLENRSFVANDWRRQRFGARKPEAASKGVFGIRAPARRWLADILLVDGDPTVSVAILQNKHGLKAIMKDGKFHKAP